MRHLEHSNRRIMLLAAMCFAFLTLLGLLIYRPMVQAQDVDSGPSGQNADTESTGSPNTSGASADDTTSEIEKSEGINLFTLLVKGGFFMLPLLALSILMITFIIERFLALRRDRVLPQELVTSLGQLGGGQGEETCE